MCVLKIWYRVGIDKKGKSSRSNLFVLFIEQLYLHFILPLKTTPATSRALLCQPLNISYIRSINIVVYTMVVYHPNNVPIKKSLSNLVNDGLPELIYYKIPVIM